MVLPMLDTALKQNLAYLAEVLAEEVARRAAEAEGTVEPEVAASPARYLTTPVDSAGARSS